MDGLTGAGSDLVLATLNARYIHAAFGLRCLLANLGELRPRARLMEFELTVRPADVVEAVLAARPKVVGLGVYIWNVREATEVVSILKRVRPEVVVVLGGPEVSYETDRQPICALADYVITGEADEAFADLSRGLLEGRRPPAKVMAASLPDLARVRLPYGEYTDRDLAERVVYVEASRGCPFSCEFCLSSLDIPVRAFPLAAFLGEMGRLLERGARQFKFVDRTFNLNLGVSRTILEFFLERMRPGLFLHFEMIPDRLPEALREVIRRFPAGSLQFEVGIQTFDPAVAERISRRQDLDRLEDNLRFLRAKTGVHVHADLIAGLPGEDLTRLAAGFDRLVALGPEEIQLGILKRLRGTPISRHDEAWGMVYSENPPYEVLKTGHASFEELQGVRRFARYWDLVVNSGNFLETAPLIWDGMASAFGAFWEWSEWLYQQVGRRHGIALSDLAERLFQFLTGPRGLDRARVARAVWEDYRRTGRSDRPRFLSEHLPAAEAMSPGRSRRRGLKRQDRRWNGGAS